jgi:NADH-quinone oxidoreductase subunit N
LLGYSGVAHTGLGLLLFAGGGGERAIVYYLSLYGGINVLALATASLMEWRTGSGSMDAWKGTGGGATAAAGWAVGSAALAGLPPTAGFAAKIVALFALWKSLGAAWTLFALGNAVVALFVYFKAPYRIFFYPPDKNRPLQAVPTNYKILIVVLTAVVAFLGLWGYGGSL